MRLFEHPNMADGWKCLICKKSDDRPVVLVPVAGTARDGIMEAVQIHAECIDVALCRFPSGEKALVQMIHEEETNVAF